MWFLDKINIFLGWLSVFKRVSLTISALQTSTEMLKDEVVRIWKKEPLKEVVKEKSKEVLKNPVTALKDIKDEINE